MSYSDDVMMNLVRSLKKSSELKDALNDFNKNAAILERLAIAIEKQNELKELELQNTDNFDSQTKTR